MAIRLPEDKNPYSDATPFEILGVSPSASTREILEVRDEKLEDLDYSFEGEQRIIERQKIMAAYDQLSDSRSRVSVEMFFFDSMVGHKEVTDAASEHTKATPDVGAVLECDENLFLTSPAVDHAASQSRKVRLKRSIQLEAKQHPFPIEPTREALESISFEQ